MNGARFVFAFAEGAAHELWDIPGLGAWAMSIGACVAMEIKP